MIMSSSILDDFSTSIESIKNKEIKFAIQNVVENLKQQKINILLIGPTGVGKSSTINAIFDMEQATVGHSVSPETNTIQRYEMENLVLWDSPGFGDSIENDRLYAQQISKLLHAKDENGGGIIDAVVVILDASNKDMGTAYEIINCIVLPALDKRTEHFFVALNQCDIALQCKHWINGAPDNALMKRLDEKAISIQERVFEATHAQIKLPIYFSALYKYNISKFLVQLIANLPVTKRMLIEKSINKTPELWKKNDTLENYNKKIQIEIKSSMEKALEAGLNGAMLGAQIGKFIPIIGPAIGASVGGALGFLGSFFD